MEPEGFVRHLQWNNCSSSCFTVAENGILSEKFVHTDGLKTHVFLQAYTWSCENFSFKNEFTYLLTYLFTR